MVDKFDDMNFHLWKFKMEMVMAKKELWDIVNGSEEPLTPLSTLEWYKYTKGERKKHLPFWRSIL